MKLRITEDMEIIITLVWSTYIAYMYTMITAYPIYTYKCVSTWKHFETGSLDLPQLTWNSLCRGQAGFRLAVMWLYPSIKKKIYKYIGEHWLRVPVLGLPCAGACECMWVCVCMVVWMQVYICVLRLHGEARVLFLKSYPCWFFFKGIVSRLS